MARRPFVVLAVLVPTAIAASIASAGQSDLSATLSGKKEVGAKGAPNGKGTFTATFRSGKLCYALRFSGLTKPAAAHIHKGTATQNGDVVVDFKPKFSQGKASRCVAVKSSIATAIRKKPSGYYVNIHTEKYPAGAVRGQLRKG